MPRRPHEPTDESRQTVRVHATVGTPQSVIADIIGIDAKTLRKHYRDELDLSSAKANAVVGGALYNKARGGDTAAMIFWMKTRAGWRETNVTEIQGKDGGPIQTQEVSPLERINSKLASIAARAAEAGDTGGTD